MSENSNYGYIAIEGNIGVGKTTLAKKLAHRTNAKIVLEKFRKNYFLPLFYNEMDKYALHVELSFLVDRFEDHIALASENEQIVSDYFFPKTLLFAKTNLDKHAYKIFERIYKNLERESLKPDLVIYLKRSVPHLLKNIKNRNRASENQIKPEYLINIQKSYEEYLNNNVHYKILSVDIEDINLKSDSTVNIFTDLLSRQYDYGTTKIDIQNK